MRLRSGEFVILAVLCDGELHGNGIMQAVFRKTDGGLMLRSSGLYRVLRGLANKGFVEPVRRPDARPGGSGERTYYRITPMGRQVVQDEADKRAKGE
jgi:DNA-binding PadR family transcriptional regulator